MRTVRQSNSLWIFRAMPFLLMPAALSACDPSLFPGIMNPQNMPGTSFASAGLITLDANNSVVINDSISGAEVDVFDLGPMAVGDRIKVTVNGATGSVLDPTLAIFDADEEVFAINDDIDLAGGNFNSEIDDFVADAGDHYYVCITKFFAGGQGGAYVATIQITRGGTAPTPPMQFLLLNFAGGPATIQGEGSFNLPAFDAADIDAAYAGQTATIKQTIADTVRENFDGTGIVVVTSDENPMLTAGTFSTLHFGAFSGTKFGVADDVDTGNRNRCDDGIIFTNQFDDPFATQPSVNGIAVAIGNVAAHEAGHLLGLNHVGDVTALMDNTGSASTLLADQDFKTAPLSPSIFPFGSQNDVKLLRRVIPQ